MESTHTDLEERIAGIAALNEPVRRELYEYVAGRREWITRDQAAEATGVSRALAAFHLDKLVEEGLLETAYERRTGRTGPGAGRPAKIYRRSQREIEISLPPRDYELAARLLAQSVERCCSDEVRTSLGDVAREFGEQVGLEARTLAGPHPDEQRLLDAAQEALADYGFQPHRAPDGSIRLSNCPFHALAQTHRSLVCGMNLSLMSGLSDALQGLPVRPVLDPQPGWCCVAFVPERP